MFNSKATLSPIFLEINQMSNQPNKFSKHSGEPSSSPPTPPKLRIPLLACIRKPHLNSVRRIGRVAIRRKRIENHELRKHLSNLEKNSRLILKDNEKRYNNIMLKRDRLNELMKDNNTFIVQEQSRLLDTLQKVKKELHYRKQMYENTLRDMECLIWDKKKELGAVELQNQKFAAEIQNLVSSIEENKLDYKERLKLNEQKAETVRLLERVVNNDRHEVQVLTTLWTSLEL